MNHSFFRRSSKEKRKKGEELSFGDTSTYFPKLSSCLYLGFIASKHSRTFFCRLFYVSWREASKKKDKPHFFILFDFFKLLSWGRFQMPEGKRDFFMKAINFPEKWDKPHNKSRPSFQCRLKIFGVEFFEKRKLKLINQIFHRKTIWMIQCTRITGLKRKSAKKLLHLLSSWNACTLSWAWSSLNKYFSI